MYQQQKTFEGIIYDSIASVKETPNALNTAYFCKKNMDTIQNSLRMTIWNKMGYKIDRQSDSELLIFMRAVYVMSEKKNQFKNIQAQVNAMNAQVLSTIIPQVASGLKQYFGYLKDASTLPTPIDRPVQTSLAGSKTLETGVFF